MTAVVYAHKAGRGNGVGLHYSRFRPSWRFIAPPNQRLGLMPPVQNRHFPPRIREVGLTNSHAVPLSSLLLNPAHMSSTLPVPTLSEGWLLRHFVWKAANKQGPPRYA